MEPGERCRLRVDRDAKASEAGATVLPAPIREAMRIDIDPPSIELAGPRREIFFDPSETCIAIVTCGGLCPGINDVIRKELERVSGGKVATS